MRADLERRLRPNRHVQEPTGELEEHVLWRGRSFWAKAHARPQFLPRRHPDVLLPVDAPVAGPNGKYEVSLCGGRITTLLATAFRTFPSSSTPSRPISILSGSHVEHRITKRERERRLPLALKRSTVGK